MSRGIINIRSSEFVVLANKLEKIGRADLPVTVRATLNSSAFAMKGANGKRGEIDKRAEKDFDYRRQKNLFKVMTGVTKADGLNINKMESEAGIINRSGMNEIAEGLANQQRGGTTNSKSTPLESSRIGKGEGNKVSSRRKLNKLGGAIKIRKIRGAKFTRKAVLAAKYGRPVLITGKGGYTYLARVKITRNRGEIDIKLDFIYRFNPTGKVKLKKKRPFVQRAADVVGKQIPREFVKQAEKRITKAFKK